VTLRRLRRPASMKPITGIVNWGCARRERQRPHCGAE
jgi:hypothetical protein